MRERPKQRAMMAVIFALVILATGLTALPDVFVSVGALQDAVIFGTSAAADTGNAAGKGPALFAGADGSSNRKRSLIEFDLASAHIPANATITNVTMTLYLAQVAGSGGPSGGGNYPSRVVSLYDLQQAWGEGASGSPTSAGLNNAGSGYARQAGDSSWDYAIYDPSNTTTAKWNAGGPDLHGGNLSSTPSATSTFTNFTTLNSPFTWSSSGMVSDVQSWISGTALNNGWLLKSDNLESSPTSFLGFWSKDGAAANTNPLIAPSLSISYTPEPGTLLLFVVSVPFVFCRRRTAEAGKQ